MLVTEKLEYHGLLVKIIYVYNQVWSYSNSGFKKWEGVEAVTKLISETGKMD